MGKGEGRGEGKGDGRGEGKGQGGGNPIEHVVVLVMENRSFDQILGYTKRINPKIDGLNGDEKCPLDPQDPSKGYATVSDDCTFESHPDPDHSIPGTTWEIWGSKNAKVTQEQPMNGFCASYKARGATDEGASVMKCFNPSRVPALTAIALQHTLMQRWFAAVPGPTMPNRAFLQAATSDGMGTNNKPRIALGLPSETIFDSLEAGGKSWKVYFGDLPATLQFRTLRKEKNIPKFRLIHEFFDDCKNDALPTVSWLEPRYFKYLQWMPNDQHPPHDVQLGDFLIADIYEAIRNSPVWEKTLFIITYDEHGGFYDHVPTPIEGVPNPDGKNSLSPPFKFDRCGIRVPCVLVSPWTPRATVINEPTTAQKPTPTSQFDHTSIAATLKVMFNLPDFLTKRDAWAATFHDLISEPAPRTDCPLTLPKAGSEDYYRAYEDAERQIETPETVAQGLAQGLICTDPISDLQEELIAIANGLVGSKYDTSYIKTEHEGALFVRKCMNEWKASASQPSASSS